MFSGWSRRKILRAIAFLAIGTTVGSIPFLSKFFVNKAQAQAVYEVYKNCRIRVVTNYNDQTPQSVVEDSQTVKTKFAAPVQLFIEDKEVRIIKDKNAQQYWTPLMPFTKYNSPQEIAKKLIDMKVKIPTGEAKLHFHVN